MRGILVFVCGALIGLLLETDRPNPGVFMLNHINILVDDMDESLAFYTETMGFENVFNLANEAGQVGVVYLEAGNDTFLKLTSAGNAQQRGLTHFSIQVEGLESVKAMYESRGARLSETFVSPNQDIRAFITDPQGVLIELFEYPPESVLGEVLAGR